MNKVEVQPIQQRCLQCGAGPWYPREDRTTDRFTKDVVVEAVWHCGNCGNIFARGIIRTEKNED